MELFNWLSRRYVVGPYFRRHYPVVIEGFKNVPVTGPYIIVAGSHTTERESPRIAAHLPNVSLRFLTKAGYWREKPAVGIFLSLTGQVAIRRTSSKGTLEAYEKCLKLLSRRGRTSRKLALLIYPEATRSTDGMVHRGGVMAAKLAFTLGIPLVPAALIDMDATGAPAKVVFGEAVFDEVWGTMDERELKGYVHKHARRLTRELMEGTIAPLSGKEYSDQPLEINESK